MTCRFGSCPAVPLVSPTITAARRFLAVRLVMGVAFLSRCRATILIVRHFSFAAAALMVPHVGSSTGARASLPLSG